MALVTVLLSSYNGEKYIVEQIESILSQKSCDVNLIVRDDGSTDSTIDILKEYKEEGKLHYITGDNLRSAKSFFELIYAAPESDYYAFSDQDDIWDEDKLSSAIQMLEEYSIPAFYHSNARLINAHGEDTGKRLHGQDPKLNFLSLACAGGILGCTMVFNKKLWECVVKHPKPERMRMHDYYLGMICLGIGGAEVYDQTPHIGYRQHGGNVLGVAVGWRSKLKSKWKQFTHRGRYTIGEQANQLLSDYEQELSSERLKECRAVANYDRNWINTLRMALTPKTHYSSVRNSLFLRMCILFRRR